MNLNEKLQADYYNTKLPYGMRESATRAAFWAERSKLETEFRSDLIGESGTANLPKDVESALFAKAWEDGHHSGYHEVAGHYQDLATLVLTAFEAGTKHKV